MLNKKYQILADENMPCIEQLFQPIADIQTRPGRAVTRRDLTDIDALLCRSITPVNAALIQGTKVQLVASATIGTDHLDIDWLNQNNIKWASAAGCNAAAVAQYVISAVCYWLNIQNSKIQNSDKKKHKKALNELTVGIVGAGNVGTELARCLELLGINYLLCDPPLHDTGDKRHLVSLDAIMLCDVISIHVPLTEQGRDKTYHLFDQDRLSQLQPNQLLINAARGSVIDNQALLSYLQKDKAASVILDVFENEPKVDPKLARTCLLATPHIAGHTLEGKLRGSYCCYRAFCLHFKLALTQDEGSIFPDKTPLNLTGALTLADALLAIYDIAKDSERWLAAHDKNLSIQFDQIRKNYIAEFKELPRRDYSGWLLESANNPTIHAIIAKLIAQ
jgi:erythronate-4-phosphate dehydrogenase